jgi:transposase
MTGLPSAVNRLSKGIPIKCGRKRLCNAAIHALRMRVECTFAWEDKFKRLLLRFECIQQRHYGMKLLAYTMINLRAFWGA